MKHTKHVKLYLKQSKELWIIIKKYRNSDNFKRENKHYEKMDNTWDKLTEKEQATKNTF